MDYRHGADDCAVRGFLIVLKESYEDKTEQRRFQVRKGRQVMKRRIVYWPFSEYDCEEAERYLNRQAEKGYLLKRVRKSTRGCFNGWAGFEKSPLAADTRYAVDVMGHDREDFEHFCRDAGWEKVCDIDDHVSVFSSAAAEIKPMYSDSLSRTERMVRLNEERYGSINPYVYILLIVVIAMAVLYFCSYFTRLIPYVMLFTFLALKPLRTLCNLIALGFASKRNYGKKKNGKKSGLYTGNRVVSYGLPLLSLLWVYVMLNGFGTGVQISATAAYTMDLLCTGAADAVWCTWRNKPVTIVLAAASVVWFTIFFFLILEA